MALHALSLTFFTRSFYFFLVFPPSSRQARPGCAVLGACTYVIYVYLTLSLLHAPHVGGAAQQPRLGTPTALPHCAWNAHSSHTFMKQSAYFLALPLLVLQLQVALLNNLGLVTHKLGTWPGHTVLERALSSHTYEIFVFLSFSFLCSYYKLRWCC